MDPSGTVDLEMIHRNGMCATAYKDSIADQPVTVSGSSGYCEERPVASVSQTLPCFEDAIPWVVENAERIAAGITGAVFGFWSDMLVVRKPRPGGEADSGRKCIKTPEVNGIHGTPIIPHLLTEDFEGRTTHLKVATYPWGMSCPVYQAAHSDWDFGVSSQEEGD